MLKTIGRTYTLPVVKRVDFGVYLNADNLGEVLLPTRYVPQGAAIGDQLEVFLHLDSEDRLIATTRRPAVQVGQFAYLPVVQVTEVGAFLDWGLEKNLLVPFAQQHLPLQEGKSYLVHVYVDGRDGRIVASSKVDQFLDDDKPHSFKPKQPVNLIIANSTELGFKAIINHSHWGLLHKDEVFQRVSFGQKLQGFIQSIRTDGKINLTLSGGQQSRDKDSRIILDYLKQHQGFAPLHDKTDAKIIAAELGISKGAFKKAIGNLYKQKLIVIETMGIRRVIPVLGAEAAVDS
jgi:hypothetical protein